MLEKALIFLQLSSPPSPSAGSPLLYLRCSSGRFSTHEPGFCGLSPAVLFLAAPPSTHHARSSLQPAPGQEQTVAAPNAENSRMSVPKHGPVCLDVHFASHLVLSARHPQFAGL